MPAVGNRNVCRYRSPQRDSVGEYGGVNIQEGQGSAGQMREEATSSTESVPESFWFGQDIDWDGQEVETFLYVELPFWLMVEPSTISIEHGGFLVPVDICSLQFEAYLGEVTDSRRTCVHRGPRTDEGWTPSGELLGVMDEQQLALVERPCRTVLRMRARALQAAFRSADESEPPRVQHALDAYWASLCEAHIPIVNELIQRYRLATYEHFPFEVAAWDVAVWWARQGDLGLNVVLVPYKRWDYPPLVDATGSGRLEPMRFTTGADLEAISSSVATPGEMDILDARSFMERGNYTDAVRRTATAIEAIVEWALREALTIQHGEEEAARRLSASANDFPGRLRQLKKLKPNLVEDADIRELETTRQIRHDIVHRARRLNHDERGTAQRCVDTGRWLFNRIEGNSDRSRLRDFGVLRAVGRSALGPRFPVAPGLDGFHVVAPDWRDTS